MALVTFKALAGELEQRSRVMLKQVRFAAAGAVTKCAYLSTFDLAKEYEKKFMVRNKSFGRAIHYTQATPAILMSSVAYKADFMELHTTGGTRKPTGGRKALSVPIYENARRMENGKTRARDRAPALLKYANEHPLKGKRHSKVKKPFLLVTGGHAYIVKRAKGNTTRESRKRGNGDLFLFSLLKQAPIEKRWDFDRIVKESVDRNLQTWYRKLLDKAIETARW